MSIAIIITLSLIIFEVGFFVSNVIYGDPNLTKSVITASILEIVTAVLLFKSQKGEQSKKYLTKTALTLLITVLVILTLGLFFMYKAAYEIGTQI